MDKVSMPYLFPSQGIKQNMLLNSYLDVLYVHVLFGEEKINLTYRSGVLVGYFMFLQVISLFGLNNIEFQ